jgi:hypothetical protein
MMDCGWWRLVKLYLLGGKLWICLSNYAIATVKFCKSRSLSGFDSTLRTTPQGFTVQAVE